jgi:hypothetical protein
MRSPDVYSVEVKKITNLKKRVIVLEEQANSDS